MGYINKEMNKNYGRENMVSGEDNTRRPDFFIVGAPRCGTSSMAEYLRQHPDVFMARIEPHFFGSDICHGKKLKEDYLGCFSEARNEKRVGEKSTWYLYSKRAAAEIKRFCPHAKIIIQLRNPVDMLYSLHGHYVYRTSREDIVDFEEALNAEEDRKKGLRILKYVRPEYLFYSEIPLYTEQIKRYVDAFGWDQIHVIVFDDLVSNTLKVYREVLRFLEVDDHTPDLKVYNPGGQVKSQIVRKFIINSWIRRVARTFLPSTTRCRVGQILSSLNISSKHRPPMEKHVRKRLQEQFAPEVEQLSKLLNRDLTYWCKD